MPFTRAKLTKTKQSRNWKFLPPVPPKYNSGCLNCGLMHTELPPDAIIAVGFGSATLTRDNTLIWYESPNDENYITCETAESIAQLNPGHDWRISFLGPLSEKEYQRQDGKWILIKTGRGFA